MHDKLARRQADHSALLNLSLVPSLRLRRYRFQHGLDGGTVRYVVTVLRCQPNLILPLRCSISLGISPVALQAIPTAFPALVNPAVRALAIAKRWWLTFQHRCAPFLQVR
jgi:hypothetical protein